MTIDLTDDEFNKLLLLFGYATGAAMVRDQKSLAYGFLALANRINQNNPNWIPYEIPKENN